MDKIAERLKVYIEAHPFDPGDSDCETVLDQLYQAYAESHESDPLEISDGFKELEECSGRAKIATLRPERIDQSGQGEIANSPVGDFLV